MRRAKNEKRNNFGVHLGRDRCGGGNPKLGAPDVLLGEKATAEKPDVHSESAKSVPLAEVFLEIEGLQVPAGVKDEVLEELMDAMVQELAGRSQKVVSAVPDYAVSQSAISQYYMPLGDAPFVVWDSFFFRSDGIQDGIVTIQDLTPIASDFGKIRVEGANYLLGDYNRDGIVNIADVSVLAEDFGKQVHHFKIVIPPGYPFTDLTEPLHVADVLYSDAYGKDEWGYKVWRVELDVPSPNQAGFYLEITPVDSAGNEGTPRNILAVVPWENPVTVTDLAVDESVLPPQVGIKWTGSFLNGDGNRDGEIDIRDVTPIVEHLFKKVEDLPPGTENVDYDGNRIVNQGDIGILYQRFGQTVTGFLIEVSTEGAEGPFVLQAELSCVFYYTIANPPAVPFWVRVTPAGNGPWEPSDPLQVE